MKFLETIKDIIADYAKHGDHRSIEDLLKMQDRLAGYSYLLGEFVGELKRDYNSDYFNRKIEFLKSKHAMINKGFPVNKAETEAELQVIEFRKKELQSEAHGYKADLLLKQANRVLNTMQQRISYLKIEKNEQSISNG